MRLLLFLLLLVPGNLLATDYYVSTTGSDGGTGAIDDPFATLEFAWDAICDADASGAGDTVFLCAGACDGSGSDTLAESWTTFMWSGSACSGASGNLFTIAVYPGETVTNECVESGADCFSLPGLDYIEINGDCGDGSTFWDGCRALILDGVNMSNGGGIGSNGTSNITIDGVEILRMPSSGIHINTSSSFFTIRNFAIHDLGDGSTTGHGIYFDGSTDNLVEDGHIYNNHDPTEDDSYGIHLFSGGSDDNIIRRLRIHDNDHNVVCSGDGNVLELLELFDADNYDMNVGVSNGYACTNSTIRHIASSGEWLIPDVGDAGPTGDVNSATIVCNFWGSLTDTGSGDTNTIADNDTFDAGDVVSDSEGSEDYHLPDDMTGYQVGCDPNQDTLDGLDVDGELWADPAPIGMDQPDGEGGGGGTEAEQFAFRWRNDDGDEDGATWIASTNTDIVVAALDENIRLRIGVRENNGQDTEGGTTLQLYYSYNSGGWTVVNASSDVVQAGFTGMETNGTATTQQLGSGSFQAGEYDDNNGLASSGGVLNDEETEVEFLFQLLSADIGEGDTVDLRVEWGDTSDLDIYTEVPRVTYSTSGTTSAILHYYRSQQ